MADATDPTTPRKDPTQAMLENVQFMRQNGFTKDEIDAEIQRWAPKIAAFSAQEIAAADPLNILGEPRMGTLRAAGKAGLEAAETVAAGFPGAQLAMAGLRSATSGIPLEQAKEQIQREVSDQGLASAVGRMAGGLPMMAAGGAIAARTPQMLRQAGQVAGQLASRVPGVRQVAGSNLARMAGTGAVMGGTEQLLSGAPGMDTERRLEQTKQGALLGALAAPVVAGVARTGFAAADLARAMRTPSRATQQMAAEARRAATTGPMFAAAEEAGKVNLPEGLRTGALIDPEITPYVEEVMSSPSFRSAYPNPTEQDIIKATREHILDVAQRAEQAAVGQAARGTQRVQAGTRMASADARELADRLLKASDITSGGKYREAVQEYAQQSQQMRRGQEAADALRAAGSGKWTPAKRLTTESPEAFAKRVPSFSPEEVQAALPMARAALRESTPLSYSALSGFGIPRAIQRTFSARQVLQPLEQAASGGKAMTPKTLRDLLMSAGVGY